MIKKFLYVSIILLLSAVGGFYLLSGGPSAASALQKPCAFCNPVITQHQTFYEDHLVLALYTHKPMFPGHCLIIPKRHVERFEMLKDEEIVQMGRVIQKVDQAVRKVFETSAYILIQKNGYEVGQSVPHVHFHYTPRKQGDDSHLKFIFKLYWSNLGSPLSESEMQEMVQKLKEAIN
jgi:diadenosine tetraphosphate (Ap4A) HIT family hydrolase